jgi:hypothetical protein
VGTSYYKPRHCVDINTKIEIQVTSLKTTCTKTGMTDNLKVTKVTPKVLSTLTVQ